MLIFCYFTTIFKREAINRCLFCSRRQLTTRETGDEERMLPGGGVRSPWVEQRVAPRDCALDRPRRTLNWRTKKCTTATTACPARRGAASHYCADPVCLPASADLGSTASSDQRSAGSIVAAFNTIPPVNTKWKW